MAQTSVLVVVDALEALWKPIAAGLTPKAPLYVGPPTGDLPATYVAVAYAGDDRPAVVGGQRPPAYGNPGEVVSEAYGVWNAVSTGTGDTRGRDRLAKVAGVYELLTAAVLANPRLGGALLGPSRASIGAFEWSIEDGGAIGTVFFQVLIDAGWV